LIDRARSTLSTAAPHRELITRCSEQGINGVVMHSPLCREHGYTGSHSAARRPNETSRVPQTP
jgi:hypothetical protein